MTEKLVSANLRSFKENLKTHGKALFDGSN